MSKFLVSRGQVGATAIEYAPQSRRASPLRVIDVVDSIGTTLMASAAGIGNPIRT